MSHWTSAKTKLKCSLNVLRRALINVMPSWEQYIKVSESGNLVAGGMDKEKLGMSIVIPHGSHTGLNYNDMGFRLSEDGTWEIFHDNIPSAIPEKIRDPEKGILGEVMRMKTHILAQQKGLKFLDETREGDKIIIRHLKKADKPVMKLETLR